MSKRAPSSKKGKKPAAKKAVKRTTKAKPPKKTTKRADKKPPPKPPPAGFDLPLAAPRRIRTDDIVLVRSAVEKLDDELIKKICALVQNGFTLSATCDFLGISTSSLYRWRRNGELYLEGDGEPKEFERYAIFLLSLKRALSIAMIELQDRLMTSELGWVKYLAMLERRDPQNFGRDIGSNAEDDLYDASETFL